MNLPRIAPTRRLLRVLAGAALLALGLALLPLLDASASLDISRWLAYVTLLLAVLSAWDYLQIVNGPAISVKRHVPQTLPLHVWADVTLVVNHGYARATEIELFDEYPPGFDVALLPVCAPLLPGKTSRVVYRVRPDRRGDASFDRVTVARTSPLKLWRRVRQVDELSSVRVYPNFAAMVQYELLAIDNRTSKLGIKRKPRRGEGMEFHQLRDYRDGDSLQWIDWKATSRRQKLISREYQDERDQQIIFLMDCGRRMRSRDGELSHFDHALNAMLLLSYVALRQGDAVGLCSFGGEPRWLPARGSSSAINILLNTVYDLQPTTQASDYAVAAQELMSRHRKRSLVVLITNLREDHSDDLLPALKLLGSRHLVLLANLREAQLDAVTQKTVGDFDEALSYAGAQHYLAMRQETQKRLARQGVMTLDVLPAQLTTGLINRYLEIKQSQML